MSSSFVSVPDLPTLKTQFLASHTRPVVLFQHDPWCGISATAHAAVAQLPWPVALVDVARQPALARLIAGRAVVRHASPQVLLLRGGVTVWSASHRAIRADAVAAALPQRPSAVPSRSLPAGGS